MYANFEVILKGDNYFLYPPSLLYSDVPEGDYCLVVDDFPDFFKYEEHDGEVVVEYLDRHGFRNLPANRFNIEKYRKKENPFEPYDVANDPWFKKNVRSEKIKKNIRFYFDQNVELKYHRKAIGLLIKIIIDLLKNTNKTLSDEEVKVIQQFAALEESVVNTIAKHPKDEESIKKIDLKKESGVKDWEKNK